jgi:hypothetical protein
MSKCRPGEEVSGRGQALESRLILRVTNVDPILERVTAATSQAPNEGTHMNLRLRTFVPYSGLTGPYLLHVRPLRQIGAKMKPPCTYV